MLNRNTVYRFAIASVGVLLLLAACATEPLQPDDTGIIRLTDESPPPVTGIRGPDTGTAPPITCCPVPEGAHANKHTDADEGCWENADAMRRTEYYIGGDGNVTGMKIPSGILSILNNAWVHLDTGEYCAEEGGQVVIGTLIRPGPITGNYKE